MARVFVERSIALPTFEPLFRLCFLWARAPFSRANSRAQGIERQCRARLDPTLGLAKPCRARAIANLAAFGDDERAQTGGKRGKPRTGRDKRRVEILRQAAY